MNIGSTWLQKNLQFWLHKLKRVVLHSAQ
jgi:hypothetical protein